MPPQSKPKNREREVFIFNGFIFGYLMALMDWLGNPHADYVLAAYGIALVMLAGFMLLSWRRLRAQDKKGRRLQRERREQS